MPTPHLPAELLDHIVDYLHDTGDALRNCCLVSKSWIPRTRKHLFADIMFLGAEDLRLWKNTFPDPSTSPACHTENLWIACPGAITLADAGEGGWVSTFSRVTRLKVDNTVYPYGNSEAAAGFGESLVPFHRFSSSPSTSLLSLAKFGHRRFSTSSIHSLFSRTSP
jgi:hypothetical protein